MPLRLACLLTAASLLALAAPAPVAAEEMRDVEALKKARQGGESSRPHTAVASQLRDQIDAILAGEEWGDDSVAADYGYPSPAKALRWANQLQLTRAQENAIFKIHEEMTFWAAKIAPEFVKTEVELEELFRSGRANPALIKRLAEKSAVLRGQLRAIHLGARAKMRYQLTAEQLRAYDLYRSGEG